MSRFWELLIHGFRFRYHGCDHGLESSSASHIPFRTPRIVADETPFWHRLPSIGPLDPVREIRKFPTFLVQFVLAQTAIEPEWSTLLIDMKNLDTANGSIRGSCCG